MNIAHNLARLIASGEVTRASRTGTSQQEHFHSVARHASHNDQSAPALERALFNTFLSALSRQEFGGPPPPPPKHIDRWGSAQLGGERLSENAVRVLPVIQHVVAMFRVLVPDLADYGLALLDRGAERNFPWIGGDLWIHRRFTPDCPRILTPRFLTAAALGLTEAGGTSQLRRHRTNEQLDALLRTPLQTPVADPRLVAFLNSPSELENLYEAVAGDGGADAAADHGDDDVDDPQ
jgi:hypothetical protein